MRWRSPSRLRPMLPPTCVGNRVARASPIMAVVVLLPTVPVMPTIRPGQRAMNRFISVVRGTPASAARRSGSASAGTAGLTTRRSGEVKSSGCCPPRCSVTSRPARAATESASFSAGAWSETVTRAPWEQSHFTTPTPPPKRPRPSTVTRFPATSMRAAGTGDGSALGESVIVSPAGRGRRAWSCRGRTCERRRRPARP